MTQFLHRVPAYKPAKYRKPDLLHPLLEHAVGVWYFNEGAGPPHNAANGRQDQLVGNVSWNVGLLGQQMDFTSAAGLDRVDLGPIAADDPINCAATQEVTIVACVRVAQFYSNQYPRIYDKSDGGYASDGFAFNLTSGNLLEFYCDGSQRTTPSPLVIQNQHTVLAVTYDTTNVRFYVDGVLEHTVAENRAIPSTVTNAAIGNWNHSATNRAFGGDIYGLLLYNKRLDDDLIGKITRNFWAPLGDTIIVPEPVGIQTIPLPIDDLSHSHPIDEPLLVPTFSLQPELLRHAHPLDEANITAQYILAIDGLRHSHPLDACDVFISEAITIAIDNLRHGHPLDEVLITPTWTLIPEALRHAHPLDESALYWHIDLTVDGLAHAHPLDNCAVEGADKILLDIDSLRHGHPVDAVAVTYETTLPIETLRHTHPVDAPAVSMLMGDATSMIGTDAGWKINAGSDLINPAGGDVGWHVIEAVFDGAGSVLGVDGSRVIGDAGVRELTILTVGAQTDGAPALEGEIGEIRIYNGVLSQAQRDAILAELQAKWL